MSQVLNILQEVNMNKAVFFDRDGVLNHDLGYIHKFEDFFWIEGAKKAIALCKEKNYKVFVVTNQSGVARALYKAEDVEILHKKVQEELEKAGTSIDEYAFCPHHPEGIVEEYSKVCSCRKPEPGMILHLAKKHDIDLSQSFIIGDKKRDVDAGINAGMEGYLFLEENIYDFLQKIFAERESK